MAKQPDAIRPTEVDEKSSGRSNYAGGRDRHSSKIGKLRHKLTTKEGWLGDYDFGWLCMPTLPVYSSRRRRRLGSIKPPPFYGVDDDLPLLLALVCGLQHALAMLAGLITPPILFANALSLDGGTQVRLCLRSIGYKDA